MWLISEEQQAALYALNSVLCKAQGISNIKISETKSGKGDGIEYLIVEFFYESDNKNKTTYFARAPNNKQLEIWNDILPTLPESLKQHITKELTGYKYTREQNVHRWSL